MALWWYESLQESDVRSDKSDAPGEWLIESSVPELESSNGIAVVGKYVEFASTKPTLWAGLNDESCPGMPRALNSEKDEGFPTDPLGWNCMWWSSAVCLSFECGCHAPCIWFCCRLYPDEAPLSWYQSGKVMGTSWVLKASNSDVSNPTEWTDPEVGVRGSLGRKGCDVSELKRSKGWCPKKLSFSGIKKLSWNGGVGYPDAADGVIGRDDISPGL